MKKFIHVLLIAIISLVLISCIKPIKEYENAKEFSEGLAAVKLKGKWGYINTKGNLIIRPTYDEAENFYKGMAWIKKNKLWGLIDYNNKYLIEPTFEKIEDYNKDGWNWNYATVVIDSKYGYIDKKNGKYLIEPIYDELRDMGAGKFIVLKESKEGFIDLKSHICIEPKYNNLQFIDSDDIIIADLKGQYGLLNCYGETVVEHKYSEIKYSETNMPLRIKYKNKYGFIDKHGREIVAPKYEDAYGFKEGLAAVKLNGKWGFINAYGKLVIPHSYISIVNFSFSDGLISVEFDNRKYGCIDRNGNIVIEPKYAPLFLEHRNKYIKAQLYENRYSSKNYGIIDRKGNIIVPFEYDDLYIFTNSINSGFIAAEKDGKQGVINRNGKIIIDIKYDDLYYNGSNAFLLKTDTNWILTDIRGNKIKDLPAFEKISIMSTLFYPISINFSVFKENGKYGIIDNDYNVVINPIYDEIGSFSEGWIPVAKDKKYFYIDFTGHKM